MHSRHLASKLATALVLTQTATAVPFTQLSHTEKRTKPIIPKVFMINIRTLHRLRRHLPIVHRKSEINAAASVSALVFSEYFDLRKTYFLIAGIVGVNPEVATFASVTFAKYAVQVALQYEFDAREIPDNFTNGHVPLGAFSPTQYPINIYGTEVSEVNAALRDIAISFASTTALNDSSEAVNYRALYSSISAYAAAAAPHSVVARDVATSDVYYSGTLLSQAFENTTKLFTNGSGVYCSTAQEDNASLEALLRSTVQNLTDFSRIIVMRTCSSFDRPPPGISAIDNLFYVRQAAFLPSIQNIYLMGVKIIEGIADGWEGTFEKGIKPENYIGDIFATLGGNPNIGTPADFITRRGVKKEERTRRVVAPRGLGM